MQANALRLLSERSWFVIIGEVITALVIKLFSSKLIICCREKS